MPLVLPELGVIIQDAKPKRDCAFPECPRRSRGFDGHKMKACAKCKYVRYCSKDCQRSHWRTHKQRCTPQGPLLSPTHWLYTYEGIFRWAAVEILRLHSADSLLKDGLTLSLTVVHGKQALGQDWPSDFLLKSIDLVHSVDDSREARRCAEIQHAGGIGALSLQAVLTNQLHESAPPITVLAHALQFDFPERPNPDYKYAPPDRVDALVRAACNGLIPLDKVEQQIIRLSGRCQQAGDVGWDLLVEVRKLKAWASDPQGQRRRAAAANCAGEMRGYGSEATTEEVLSRWDESDNERDAVADENLDVVT